MKERLLQEHANPQTVGDRGQKGEKVKSFIDSAYLELMDMEIWNTESSRVAANCRDIIRTNNRKGVTLRCVWNLVPIFVLLWRKGLKIFFAHNLSEWVNLCSHISKHMLLMLCYLLLCCLRINMNSSSMPQAIIPISSWEHMKLST